MSANQRLRGYVARRIAMAVLAGLVINPMPALAQGGATEMAALAAKPVPIAPKLRFDSYEMALAKEVAWHPGLAAFYGSHGLKPVFTSPADAPRREALFAAVAGVHEHGLSSARYQTDLLKSLPLEGSDHDRARAEAAFAITFAAYAHDVSTGVLTPARVDSGIKREIPRKPLHDILARYVAEDPVAVLASLPPADPRYGQLQAAMLKMRGSLAPEGTPQAPAGVWRAGMSGPQVADLRARLSAVGFPSDPSGEIFDESLAQAVAAYQAGAGLKADGIAGPATASRLNAQAGPQLRAVLVAMERMRWMNGLDLGARHVWVNLPEFNVRIIEEGQEVFLSRTVIGSDTPDRRSPEFTGLMDHMVVNPRWNVPRSITVKEYLPRLQKNPNSVGHLDIVDGRGRVVPRGNIDFGKYTASNFPYRMQQKPSDDNALGLVKFMFPNPWNIYLHDTPSKSLFANSTRAYSHGCIRVGKPFDLAYELLSKQSADPKAMFTRTLNTGRETWVHIEPPLPVHLVYFTAFPDESGQIHYYGDIYGRDARIYAALQKPAVALAGVSSGGQGD